MSGFHLELLLSDPDYYADTSTDPVAEVLAPWGEWVARIGPHLNGEPTVFGLADPARFGSVAGMGNARFELWDIRWLGERCEVLVMDVVRGDEWWWAPPEPAPAELMRHARRIDTRPTGIEGGGR